jgi:hypothetical protein
MGKNVGAGARAGAGGGDEIFDKLEPELHEIGPAPQHCFDVPVPYNNKN